MGQSDDIEDSTYSRHQDLCQKLNMDAIAASEAWKSYETIRQNYTLEASIFILSLYLSHAYSLSLCNLAIPTTIVYDGHRLRGRCFQRRKTPRHPAPYVALVGLNY